MDLRRLIKYLSVIALAVTSVGCGGTDHPTQAERQLIAKANAICADSWRAMKKVDERFPESKPLGIFRKIYFAQAVVNVSQPMAERLAALQPPASIHDSFEEYVEGEQRVYYDDLTALHASHAAHNKEYAAARKQRTREQLQSFKRGEEIGLERCASP